MCGQGEHANSAGESGDSNPNLLTVKRQRKPLLGYIYIEIFGGF